MSDVESRALGRVAVLLLAASAVRAGWGAVGLSEPPPAPDALPGLLAESRAQAGEQARRAAPLAPDERVDPNRASAAELDRLPGVGPSTAAALVRSRQDEGPYRRPDDLLRVRGIGPALLARIRPHLELDDARPAPPGSSPSRLPPTRGPRPATGGPVDINRADTLELQGLPGVGPALARRIVEARGQAPFRSVDDLLRVRGIGPATLARLRSLVSLTGR